VRGVLLLLPDDLLLSH